MIPDSPDVGSCSQSLPGDCGWMTTKPEVIGPQKRAGEGQALGTSKGDRGCFENCLAACTGLLLAHDREGTSNYEWLKPEDYVRGVNELLAERTVISLYAGLIAQQKFCQHSPEKSASLDREDAKKLILKMHEMKGKGESGFEAWVAKIAEAEETFQAEASGIVCEHWTAIESLAETLWAQPTKELNGGHIVELLKKTRYSPLTV